MNMYEHVCTVRVPNFAVWFIVVWDPVFETLVFEKKDIPVILVYRKKKVAGLEGCENMLSGHCCRLVKARQGWPGQYVVLADPAMAPGGQNMMEGNGNKANKGKQKFWI